MGLTKEELQQRIEQLMAKMKPPTPELDQKRRALMAEAEREIKATSGTLQALLRKMNQVLQGLEPNSPGFSGLSGEINTALQRYLKDPNSPKPFPPIAVRIIEYVNEHLRVTNYPSEEIERLWAEHEGRAAAPRKAAPAPQPKVAPKRPNDGFESGSQPRSSLSLNPEAPVAATPSLDLGKIQNLESFQVWTQNPSLGNKKG